MRLSYFLANWLMIKLAIKMIRLVYPFPQESAIPEWYQIITIFRIISRGEWV